MMWQLMWHNVRVAALNATLKLLVILDADSRNAREKKLFIIEKNTISLLRTQMIKLKTVHS